MLFSKSKELSAAEMANSLEINISSIYRILNTMEEMNFLKRKSNKKYELVTGTVLQLYNMVSKDLRDYAKPVIQEIAYRFKESVYMSELYHDNQKILIIEKEDSPKPLKWIEDVGSTYNMPIGTAGKTHLTYLLEQLNNEEQTAYLSQLNLQKFTEDSVTSLEDLLIATEQIKKDGYCITVGEHVEDIVGISVPIFNSSTGYSINTLTMVMTESSYDSGKKMKYVTALRDGASNIGRNLI